MTDISVNLAAVFVAAVAMFVVGAIWYMPLFGDLWGRIHGFDKQDKKTQDEMRKGMMPLLAVQFVLGLTIAYVLAHVIGAFPDENAYMLAIWMWLGFVVPTQIAAVIFGGTEPKWMVNKSLVMAGGSLATVLVAAGVINLMG